MTAEERLQAIEVVLPRLRQLAKDGELDGDYFEDVDKAAELLEAIVEAFE